MYGSDRLPNHRSDVAISRPPSAGPTIALTWKMLEFHVAAFGKSALGTMFGSSAERAGRPIVSTHALAVAHAYIQNSMPARYEKIASPTEQSALSTAVT